MSTFLPLSVGAIALFLSALSLSHCVLYEAATVFSRVDSVNLDMDGLSGYGWFLRFEPSSFHCNPRSPSRFIPSVCAEFIESILILFGSVDAARSCGSNPGRRKRFHLGRITVSIALSLPAALRSGSCNVIWVLYLFPSRWTNNTWLISGEIDPARSGCFNASRRMKIV
eukprot:scaffold217680_cov47-Attheya_sp.AAC.1